jgi:arylsulfatase A-like enzyme
MNDSRELTRRHFLAGAVAAGVASHFTGKAPQPFRPNIVYIHSHDSGRYLQPYGADVSTPALQKLASEGAVFRNAFSAAPTCSPSRAALLTGLYPHNNGMLGLAHRGFSLNDYSQHILYTLRAHGYTSVLAGLQHIAPDPHRIGFDRLLAPADIGFSQILAAKPVKTRSYASGRLSAREVAPAAAAFLDTRPQTPFFLDVGFFETHREYPDPEPEDLNYTAPPRPIPDVGATRRDFASYRASARILDEGVRQVLDAIDRNGLRENTLIISTTDHGVSFPRMKCNLTDDGWGVSLILRGPGISPGTVYDALVSQLDVFPTLCDYLVIERPSWLQGKSFLPILKGNAREIHDEIFAEINYHAAYEPQRAVRTTRWKYIRRFGDRTTPVLPNCDDSPSKTLWLDAGWKSQPVAQEELYDLLFDPTEHNNLASDPAHQATLSEMRDRLHRWMVSTNDPLLHGPVAAPPGARVNDPDGVSPQEPTRPAS